MKPWSKAHDACTACGTTDRPHRARGLCRRCYGAQPDYAARHNARNRARRDSDEFRARARAAYHDDPHRNEVTRRAARRSGMERRAREHGCAVGVVTDELIEARVAFYGGRCWMCGAPWEHLDHVKPLSKGGAHIPANLRPACASCNLSKHEKWEGIDTALVLSAA